MSDERTNRAILTGATMPANEWYLVEIVDEDDERPTVAGSTLPNGEDTFTPHLGQGRWYLTPVPDALADLDAGHYLTTREDDHAAVRDLSECGVFATVYDAPVVTHLETPLMAGDPDENHAEGQTKLGAWSE